MDWARILAYVTGTVDQELLAPRRELHRRRPRPRKRPLDFRSFPSAIHRRYNSLSCVGETLEIPITAGIPSWTC
jgi:hypothetical protein